MFEEHRRLKIISNAFGERAVLKLIFARTPSAERWRSFKVTDAVRRELIRNTRAQVGRKAPQLRMPAGK
jgi:hypothetical protein